MRDCETADQESERQLLVGSQMNNVKRASNYNAIRALVNNFVLYCMVAAAEVHLL